jgi:hypothetical protein
MHQAMGNIPSKFIGGGIWRWPDEGPPFRERLKKLYGGEMEERISEILNDCLKRLDKIKVEDDTDLWAIKMGIMVAVSMAATDAYDIEQQMIEQMEKEIAEGGTDA